MLRKYKTVWLQLLATAVIIALCLVYVKSIGYSGAWFYNTYSAEVEYQIGKIDFVFFGEKEHTEIPFKLLANAPTRHYELENPSNGIGKDYADKNFNKAATVKLICGTNIGDVDINVELSLDEDYLQPSDSVFYYLFVPIDNTDTNFTQNFLADKDYAKYLSNVFTSPAEMDTFEKRRAAYAAKNKENLAAVSEKILKKNVEPVPLGYLIYWPEYDLADDENHWMDPVKCCEYDEIINLHAYAYQDHMNNP